jgi:hypothetical protein
VGWEDIYSTDTNFDGTAKILTKNLWFKDLLNPISTVFTPVIDSSATVMQEGTLFNIKPRSCYPFDDDVKLEINWGDGSIQTVEVTTDGKMTPISNLWTSEVNGSKGTFGYNFHWAIAKEPHHFKISEVIYPLLGKPIYSSPYALGGNVRKKYAAIGSRLNGERIKFTIWPCDSLNLCSAAKTIEYVIGANTGET